MRRRYSLGGMTEAKQRLVSDLENLSPKQRRIYQRQLNTIMTDSRFDILTEEDLADYVNGWYGEDVVTRMDFTGPKAFNFGFKVLALWESQKRPEFWEEKMYMEKGGRIKMMKVQKELINYGHTPKTAIKLIDEYKNKVNLDSEPQQIAWEIDKMSGLSYSDYGGISMYDEVYIPFIKKTGLVLDMWTERDGQQMVRVANDVDMINGSTGVRVPIELLEVKESQKLEKMNEYFSKRKRFKENLD